MISKGPGLGCLFPAPRSGFNPSRRAQAVPTASGAAHVTCECGVGSHRDGPMAAAPAAGSDRDGASPGAPGTGTAGPGRPCEAEAAATGTVTRGDIGKISTALYHCDLIIINTLTWHLAQS